MDDIHPIRPASNFGRTYLEDVLASLEGLQPGTYAARDLYARYSRVTREAGRRPGHKVAFGQWLARLGLDRRRVPNPGGSPETIAGWSILTSKVEWRGGWAPSAPPSNR